MPRLVKAFLDMQERRVVANEVLHDVQILAETIEPFTRGQYRQTPVTFISGNQAANASNIPRLMNQWADNLGSMVLDERVKMFLDIHPFQDGNGRTASVLYNPWNATLAQPVRVPDFYPAA